MIVTATYTDDSGEWYGPVLVNGQPLSPTRSQKLANHSPDGFAWGYYGSGPAQLALALLLEAGADDAVALRWHQQFKNDVIAAQPNQAALNLTMDIAAWIAERERMARS